MHMYFNINRILSCNNSHIRNTVTIKGLNDGRNKTETSSTKVSFYIIIKNRVVFDEICIYYNQN